jgi:hypothetical protein
MSTINYCCIVSGTNFKSALFVLVLLSFTIKTNIQSFVNISWKAEFVLPFRLCYNNPVYANLHEILLVVLCW